MNTSDVIRYVIKNYPYPNELSKARINKIIYLVDWKSAIQQDQQITDIQWVFNHYGPYVDTIETLIRLDDRFYIEEAINPYGSPKHIVTLETDIDFNEPDGTTKEILDFIIEKTKRFYWDKFIQLVYSTYPIISQEKGSNLDLVVLAKEYKELKKNN